MDCNMIAIIRIKGDVDVRHDFRQTLALMRLHRKNHLVLIPETQEQKGMVKKVQDLCTFGEINIKTLAKLLEKRGMLTGDKRITPAVLKEKKLSSFDDLAKKVMENPKVLVELDIKPVFRLNSPKKGFERKGMKATYKEGGCLGNRGTDINDLIERMM